MCLLKRVRVYRAIQDFIDNGFTKFSRGKFFGNDANYEKLVKLSGNFLEKFP